MRMAWKTILAGVGLMLAATGAAAQEAPAAAPTAATVNSAATAPDAAASPAATPAPVTLSAKEQIGVPHAGAIGLQPQVTRNGERAAWFHDVPLLWTISLISLFVLALLIFVMVRFRRSEHREPSKTSHNTAIEVVWTLLPVVILVGLAVPSIGLLSAQFKPAPANAVTLKAIGNQWYWTYQYPDHGEFEITANMLKERDDPTRGKDAPFRTDADGPRLLAADNRIVLPVGVPIRLITTANDVIHSWAVPAFWIKLDAVPGRLNETSFTIEKPGLYYGQCSELCGARHGYMPIAVEAVSPAEFAAWIASKGGTMPGSRPAAAAAAPAAAPIGNAADAANPPAGTGPVTNTSTTPPTTSQPATANPAAVGGN